ncbi:valine--tRNA ligase, partial [Cytophagaceae bacterium AH-315-L13]|nr:valine--tRNA ligase [Cytophagaceae bacterium AH-315-L13]
IIKKLANIDQLTMIDSKVDGALSFAVGSDEIFVELEGKIDVEAEVSKLTKELEHAKGFLKSVDAKLSNQGFVSNASAEVVDREKQKKADAESKIKVLEDNLANLMAMEK